VGNSRLYTGRDYLPALGVYDYRQRAYDPATGRFLTTDPIGSFGDPANLGNPYTYVANNPGSFVDPFGEEGWKEYFSTIVADPFQHYILGTLGGDNSEAFARHKARQSALIDPAAAGETFGETGERYAPHVGPQLGQAFDDTLEDASRSGLAGAQFLTGPAGAAANVIAVADDIGQGNWGSAILGGAGAIGSIRSIIAGDEVALSLTRGQQLEFDFVDEFAKSSLPARNTQYRKTFFAAHPELQGKVVVHHAIEQQVTIRYPGIITDAELHSLENLRGIPLDQNSRVHLRNIRREWDEFYATHPIATKQQLLQKVHEIDAAYGHEFLP
jgi:RHS repeat-associated protein